MLNHPEESGMRKGGSPVVSQAWPTTKAARLEKFSDASGIKSGGCPRYDEVNSAYTLRFNDGLDNLRGQITSNSLQVEAEKGYDAEELRLQILTIKMPIMQLGMIQILFLFED